jgi:hypothetical protein
MSLSPFHKENRMRESPPSKADSPVETEEPQQSPSQAQEETEERRENTAAVLANTAYLWGLLLILLPLVLYVMCR